MKTKIIILTSLICLFSFCEKENEKIDLNDYITLKYGSSIKLPSNNTIVSFKEVDDNRCPLSVCYLSYGTRASITLSISNNKEQVGLDLQIWGGLDGDDINNDSADTLGYKFQLIRLNPYPDDNAINENDYIAKLKITKL